MKTKQVNNYRKYARKLLYEMCDKEEEIMWLVDNLNPNVKKELHESIKDI